MFLHQHNHLHTLANTFHALPSSLLLIIMERGMQEVACDNKGKQGRLVLNNGKNLVAQGADYEKRKTVPFIRIRVAAKTEMPSFAADSVISSWNECHYYGLACPTWPMTRITGSALLRHGLVDMRSWMAFCVASSTVHQMYIPKKGNSYQDCDDPQQHSRGGFSITSCGYEHIFHCPLGCMPER
jgi:hypothetical protein